MSLFQFSTNLIYSALVFSILASPLIVFTRQYLSIDLFSRLSFVVIFFVITIHHFIKLIEISYYKKVKLKVVVPFFILFYVLILTLAKDINGYYVDYFYVFTLLYILSFVAFGDLEVIKSSLLRFMSFFSKNYRAIIFYYLIILGFYKLDLLSVHPYSSFDVEFLPFLLIFLLHERKYTWALIVFLMIIFSFKFSYAVSLVLYFFVVFFSTSLFHFLILSSTLVLLFTFWDLSLNSDVLLQWLKVTNMSLFERFSEVIYAFKNHSLYDYILGAGFTLNITGEFEGLHFENRKYMHNSFGFLFYSFGLISILIISKVIYASISSSITPILARFILFLVIVSFFKLTFLSELFAICLLTLALRYNFHKR